MKRWVAAAALVFYGALAVALFASTWQAPATHVIGSNGDPFVYVWFLRWFAFSLTHGLNPFVTDYVNYPQGYNVMWNTPMPLAGWILTPVTLWVGPVVAYNAVVTSALALSAWSAFLVFGRYLRSRLAALVGGLVYGFSPFMVIQAVGHWHVVMAFTPPLVLLLVDEIVVRTKHSAVRLGLAAGVLGAVQMLLSEEILATEVLTAVIALAILAVLYRHEVRGRIRRVATASGVAAMVTALLTAVPLWEQFFGPNHITGVIQPRNVYVTDLLNLVVPTDFQWLAPGAALQVSNNFTGNGSEWNGYLGIPLLAVCIITAYRYRRDAVVRVVALVGLAMVLLSFGPHLHVGGHDTPIRLPYVVVDHLPLFGNLLPNRLALYVDLLAALLLAVFIDRQRAASRATWIVAVAAVGLVMATLVPRVPYQASPTETPSFFTTSAVQRLPEGEVVLVAPYSSSPAAVQPLLWQAQADLRFRIPEGYLFTAGPGGKARLGPAPFALSDRMLAIFFGGGTAAPTAAEVARYRLDLDEHAVGAVIVGPMAHQQTMVGLFTAVIGASPEAVGGVFLWPHAATSTR